MASCLSEEPPSPAALHANRPRRSSRRCELMSAEHRGASLDAQPCASDPGRRVPGTGSFVEEDEATTSYVQVSQSQNRTRGSSSRQQRSAVQQPRRASISGERPAPLRRSPEEAPRRSSLDVLRWLEDAHSSYTAGLTAADMEAASSSPDSPHIKCKGEALDLLELSRPARRLSGDGGERSSAKKDPGLEAALQQRRERRGQRRLDRMVRRMSLLDRRNSVSDGSFDWLKPEDLQENPPVEGIDRPLPLSAPGRMLPDANTVKKAADALE